MADLKTGTVVYKELVSQTLMRFRLMPQLDSRFPDYEAGQYIALRRDDCKLTRKLGVAPRWEADLRARSSTRGGGRRSVP